MPRQRPVLPEKPRCQGTVADGSRCINRARFDGLCSIHKREAEAAAAERLPEASDAASSGA